MTAGILTSTTSESQSSKPWTLRGGGRESGRVGGSRTDGNQQREGGENRSVKRGGEEEECRGREKISDLFLGSPSARTQQ